MKRPKLNPKEAPKGYIAVPPEDPQIICSGCAFETDRMACCQAPPCAPHDRQDGCDVIFIKAPKRPRPKATFARWRKDVGCPPVFAQLRIGGQVGNNLLVSMKNAEAYAERAWNAGYRAAGRRSRK